MLSKAVLQRHFGADDWFLADFDKATGKLNPYLSPLVKSGEFDKVWEGSLTAPFCNEDGTLKEDWRLIEPSDYEKAVWQDRHPDYGITAFANSSAKESKKRPFDNFFYRRSESIY
jgi:hypothetical protein